jgi:hypothetical protein
MPQPRHAILLSAGNTHLRYIPVREGYDLVEEGYVSRVFGGGLPTFRLENDEMTAATPGCSQASIKSSDMQANAAAVCDHKRNRARHKTEAWPTVCDTFAITVVDGRVYIPDPRAAEKRVKKMRKAR